MYNSGIAYLLIARAHHPFFFVQLPSMLAFAGIHYFSELPGNSMPPLIPFSDKVLHALGYGILTLLLFRTLREVSSRTVQGAFLTSAAYTVLWGIIEECNQHTIPGRYFDFGDILANAIGSLLLALPLCPLIDRIDQYCKVLADSRQK